jgi:Zn finger protein HypA/HybF involved in hydrogenase expression
MSFMEQDAMEKVAAGFTTLEEVMRVVPFEGMKGSLRCRDCNKHLVPGFVYCPYCGAHVSRNGSRARFIKAPTPVTEMIEEDFS